MKKSNKYHKKSLDRSKQVRIHILIFVALLLLSGVTAWPLETEGNFGIQFVHILPDFIVPWILRVYDGIHYNAIHYPFIQYGTDWLAFAHVGIAIAFWGPYHNPFRNIWVIQYAMILSLLIIPNALICGYIRHIPFVWQCIDMSFGIVSFFYLLFIYKKIKKIEQITFHT